MHIGQDMPTRSIPLELKPAIEKMNTEIHKIAGKVSICFAQAKLFLERLFTGTAMPQTIALGGLSLVCFFKIELVILTIGVLAAQYTILLLSFSIIDTYKYCKYQD